jgi:ribosome maturation factor RimP
MGFELARVQEIAERVAASLGLEVVEVEMRGAGNARMLRIYIDRPAASTVDAPEGTGRPVGVTHEDCANLSREVGTILDVEDAVPGGSYVLEVSSPGLDRKLSRAADFERFIGSRVKVATRNAVNGSRHFAGRLESFHGGRLTLDVTPASTKPKGKKVSAQENVAAQKIEIDLANVEKANLVPEI